MPRCCALLVAVSFLSLTGCADTPDSLAREQVALVRETVSILEGVTDEASAKAADPQLKQVRERGKSLKARVKALNLTEAQQKAALKPYEKELQQHTGRMTKVIYRVAHLASRNPELAEALQTLGSQ